MESMTSHTHSLQVRVARIALSCFPLTLLKSIFLVCLKNQTSQNVPMFPPEFPCELLPCSKDFISAQTVLTDETFVLHVF